MKITRDVVTDLLPAYLANEASADSRALVEEFFRQDPEFARLAKENQKEDLLGAPQPSPLGMEQELETLIRTRASLQLRSFWRTFAILFTLFPLSSTFSSKGLVWIMIRDAPAFAETCIVIAIICWVMYLRTRRKLRSTGI
jgi:anti-sigma factor RsiW